MLVNRCVTTTFIVKKKTANTDSEETKTDTGLRNLHRFYLLVPILNRKYNDAYIRHVW